MPKFVDAGYVKSSPTAEGTTRQLWDTDGNLYQGGSVLPSLANGVTGIGAGYKIARGTTTPTAGSQAVATGLATVVAVVVSLKGDPTLTHMWSTGDVGNQAGAPAAGSFTLKSWKPTANNDVTPVAATTPWGAVHWIAIGT